MAIEFKKIDGKLILIYIPAMGIDDIKRRLNTEEGILIKHTFFVTKDLLCEKINDEDEWEETANYSVSAVR